MDQGHEFSDAFIDAFVDALNAQLMLEEKAWVYAHPACDEGLNRRVRELRKFRDLIRLARQELPMPGQARAILSAKTAGRAKLRCCVS